MLCALDVKAANRVDASKLDKCADAIIEWFSDADGDSYEEKLDYLINLSESSILRSFIHLGLQCEQNLFSADDETRTGVIASLLHRLNSEEGEAKCQR